MKNQFFTNLFKSPVLNAIQAEQRGAYIKTCIASAEYKELNEFLKKQCTNIFHHFDEAKSDEIFDAIQALSTYQPLITRLIEQLKAIHSNSLLVADANEAMRAFFTELKALNANYAPITRIINDSTLMRRYDSLARIFSLGTSFSVCSAITISNGRVIISANINAGIKAADIAEKLLIRLSLIRLYQEQAERLIKLHPKDDYPIYDDLALDYDKKLYDKIQKLIEQPYLNLIYDIKNGSNAITRDRIAVDFHKITDAFLGISTKQKKTHFSKLEIQALLINPPVILVPVIKEEAGQKQNAGTMGYNVYLNQQEEPTFVPLALKKISSTKFIHAEQLIVHYIDNHPLAEHMLEQNLHHVGVSKLCCETCCQALERVEWAEFRGTHGITYQGTALLPPSPSSNSPSSIGFSGLFASPTAQASERLINITPPKPVAAQLDAVPVTPQKAGSISPDRPVRPVTCPPGSDKKSPYKKRARENQEGEISFGIFLDFSEDDENEATTQDMDVTDGLQPESEKWVKAQKQQVTQGLFKPKKNTSSHAENTRIEEEDDSAPSPKSSNKK